MAELNASWDQGQTWAQYSAIARLRWLIFLNASRRKGGAGEMVGRILLLCILGSMAVFFTAAAFGAAWFLTSRGQISFLWLVFWAIFLLCQFLNINLGQPGTTFDPTELIRFPMRLPTYTAIRLFFNLLSPANVVAAATSLAVAAGVTVARPGLWLYALLACAVFALTNVLFSRMVFAWVDRWLSTRRAREIFTAAIFVGSLGFQYVNLTFNPTYSGHRHRGGITHQHMDTAALAYQRARTWLAPLPPSLTSAGLASAELGQPGAYTGDLLGCAAYGALFLAVFALRMRTEFRGEALSDAVAAPRSAARQASPVATNTHAPRAAESGSLSAATVSAKERRSLLPGPLSALLTKEWLYVRRNTGLLYGLVTPLFLVILFAYRMGRNTTGLWITPLAVAYSLLGIAQMSYNSFGLEGTGAQLYFLAPVPLRQVLLAKNLMHFALAAVELIVVLIVIGHVTTSPGPLMVVALLLWAAMALLLNTSLGNRRSITAPKKIALGRAAGKQASQTSALLSLGVLLGCVGVGAAVLLLGSVASLPWLPLAVFLPAAVGAAFVYRASLVSGERLAFQNRDTLFEELSKR